MENEWIDRALEAGFTYAVPVDIATLQPQQAVRDMCSSDRCRAYGKNWTCPPHCGTLQQCAGEIARCNRGILVQTVGTTEKLIDTKAYRRIEQQHLQQFHALARQLRRQYPKVLCLGAGGCRICPECAFPQPCRFPEEACASMEGYGLFVSRVCRENGLAYHHGERTVTYTACLLW